MTVIHPTRLQSGDGLTGVFGPNGTRSLGRQLARRYYALRNPAGYNESGVDVFAADWDTLVILDACRYDAFRARSELPGDTERRVSRGSMTPEWVRANFANRRLHDTVYVTANGNYARVADEIDAELHRVVGLWEDEHRVGPDDAVLLPETVTEAAVDAYEQHPNKRLLVHYVQPHYPYVGPTGRERFDPTETLTSLASAGDLSSLPVRQAYRENLDLVLSEVERLLETVEGRTVVTSDHGELLGERLWPVPMRDYGHPGGIYVEDLVTVPWHVYESGGRRRVVSEPPVETTLDDEAVRRNLRRLGYVD